MIRFICAIALTLAAGVAWAQDDITSVYRPSAEATRFTDMSDAEKALRRIAGSGDYHEFFGVAKPNFGGSDTIYPVASIKFENDAVVLVLEGANLFDSGEPPVRIPYASLGALEVVERTYIRKWSGVKLTPETVLWHRPSSDGKGTERATLLADALFALYTVKIEEPKQEARFAEVAASYRAASPKPVLTEEGRKYKVQAEFMVKQKKFADAARLYGAALKAAPWWPEGHFNRALILGELKQTRQAIVEMQRYLQLVPNAPDARAAQDKIYEWEALAPK